jgi:hypothetical protein
MLAKLHLQKSTIGDEPKQAYFTNDDSGLKVALDTSFALRTADERHLHPRATPKEKAARVSPGGPEIRFAVGDQPWRAL